MSFEFKKSLGQNFLIDENIINKIINSIDVEENSLIIEVGPGNGALTKKLVNLNAKILCFEIDKRLKTQLDQIQAANIDIIYEDILKINLEEVLKDYSYNKLFLVSNLPYYITTPIVNKFALETNVEEMIIMIQKEVADRFNASPRSKEYNSLSVFLQYNFNISKICNVSRNSFIPKPNVDSIVLKLVRREKEELKNEEHFYELVRDSFKYKRKNLRNNLKGYDLEKLKKALENNNKSLTSRAEELSIIDFINISNELF